VNVGMYDLVSVLTLCVLHNNDHVDDGGDK